MRPSIARFAYGPRKHERSGDAQPFNREDMPRQAGSCLSSQTLGVARNASPLRHHSVAQPRRPVSMFGLVLLPPIKSRVVVQTWRLTEPPINCTRSLELVGKQAYIVSRCVDPDGNQFGGNDVTLLEQLSETTWLSPANQIVWQVNPDATLVATKNAEVVFAGVPCQSLWPQ